ncbi:FAD-dependent monooxygenase [Streptomyces netropsis]|uniref:FAD-dependent monooxygenase n=1 Tax=Streptomyces netropsis TaxID=55404 RepID=UPI0037AB8599
MSLPSNTSATEVLIAGAGPTGLVLAIDLARRGVRHRIVDRSERGFPGSRGTGIQPRSQEVLDDLGAIDALWAAGGPCPLVQIWEGTTRAGEQRIVEPAEPSPGVPYDQVLMIPQWRTVEILTARLEELGGRVEFGTELTGFDHDADGVTATLRDAGGTERTVRAEYLVAADGGRSTVRKALGVAFTGEQVDPRPVLIADVIVEGELLDRDHWHMWPRAKGGILALRPLENVETYQVMASFADTSYEPDPARDATPEALARLISERSGHPGVRTGEVRWASVYRARAAMAERFRTGRVLLAGDAAHVHSPAGGQGLNTSLQDAYNLGWKLGAVLRLGAPDALLDTYDTERTRVAADVLRLSTSVHQADRAAGNGPSRRGRETHQLTLNYRESPLTRELRRDLPEGALRAGDRAPDAPTALASGTAVRLFDAFRGPHFTLLAVGDTECTAPAAAWVRTYRVGGGPAADLLDMEGHAKAAYGSGLFLIRPDGYVGLATDDPADVAAYLARVAG